MLRVADSDLLRPVLDDLLSLRRRGKTVLLGHHSNRLGGSRGHSKAEDTLNLVIKLTRPEGYTADQGARFLVTFEKTRGVHGAAVSPFEARLTSSGWEMACVETPGSRTVVTSKLLEFVRLAHSAGERPRSATAAIRHAGVNKAAGLRAWADLLKRGELAKHPEGGFYVA